MTFHMWRKFLTFEVIGIATWKVAPLQIAAKPPDFEKKNRRRVNARFILYKAGNVLWEEEFSDLECC
ncbi:MAG: hypothetical protein DMF21_09550 [Verrucomicrobia bacterium]|nr:MAG: hypothetical protein DMF09_00725 [Verrucomicrobiota bacterium]PYL80248.1 MAG: hypothetical protein DMF21_09550 [Verrucomicrobiota bacterium]